MNTLATGFEDMPDDIPSGVSIDRAEPAPVVYTEPCPKCGGSGRFRGYSGFAHGPCFKCGGRGSLSFKTPWQDRQKAAAGRANKAQAAAIAKSRAIGEWRAANPLDAAWIDSREGRFDFATQMAQALVDWGTLTERQHAAVTRLRLADEQRSAAMATEKKEREASAPTIDTTALEEAFARASSTGLRSPRIVLGDLTFKLSSKGDGAIYVTRGSTWGSPYLGKVLGGKFLRVREATEAEANSVAELVRDPRATAEAYGLKTGRCCLCHKLLTNQESLARGVGPICAEKYGW